MKKYQEPEIEIEKFRVIDIITESEDETDEGDAL